MGKTCIESRLEKRAAIEEKWIKGHGDASVFPPSKQAQVFPVSGTTEQAQQIFPVHVPEPPYETTTSQISMIPKMSTREQLPWPKWDGALDTFSFYAFELKVKIEEDLELLGSNRAICYRMLWTLPDDKKPRVQRWFRKGGENKAYDWRLFLEHFHDKFDYNTEWLLAGETLLNMRQAEHQYFRDFVHDFECKLAQCSIESWNSQSLVTMLRISMNNALRGVLIGADLPPDTQYEKWVKRVREIADNLDVLSRRPKDSTQTTTYYISRGDEESIDENNYVAQPEKSSENPNEGPYSINGNLKSTTFLRNKIPDVNPNSARQNEIDNETDHVLKPRAPWLPPAEFSRLLDEGLCIRCASSDHSAMRCPTFRPACRPGST